MTDGCANDTPLLTLQLFGRMAIRVNGVPLPPLRSRKGMWLLALLALQPGREASRAWLAETLWPDSEDPLATLRRTLTDLRQALGAAEGCLQNLPGRKLRLQLPETAVDALEFDLLAAQSDPAAWKRALELYRGALLEDCDEPWAIAERKARQETFARLSNQQVSTAAEQKTIPAKVHAPYPLTGLIGREADLRRIAESFTHSRLVTLTGAGGIGKTRLAIEAAHSLSDSFPDGIWFVELALTADPAMLARTITARLRLREEAERPALETAADFLADRAALLILDNCEHLLTACLQVVETMLQKCPRLAILTTSRQALGMTGEIRLPVLPLAVASAPSPSAADPVENFLKESPAARLFAERAAAVLADFRITPQNLPATIQVCAQLDGIPLALEMAAARIKVMSVEQIAARLTDRFRLLNSGSRVDLPHHQTLRALIDWSHDLLSLEERALLRRLSVFVGGCTLEAVECVCADEGMEEYGEERRGWNIEERIPGPTGQDQLRIEKTEVLDLLGLLVERSLLRSEDEPNGERRFQMLQTLREYALERLNEAGEKTTLQRRHRDYFRALATQAHAQMQSREQNVWLERLDREYENIRAALRFCLEDPDSGAVGLELAARMGEFWWIRGYEKEGRMFVERALQHPGGRECGAARAQALNIVGVLASNRGDFTAALSFLEESLRLQRELGDGPHCAVVLTNLGNLYREYGREDLSRACLEESLEINRRHHLPARVASSLTNLAGTAFQQYDYAFARQCYEEAVAMRRELGNPRGIAISQCGLGQVLIYLEETENALACFEEAETIFRQLNDRANLTITLHSLGILLRKRGEWAAAYQRVLEGLEVCRETGDILIVVLLNELAGILKDSGQPKKAARMFGVASGFAQQNGMMLKPEDQERMAASLEELRVKLGEAAFLAAWEAGSRMDLEQALQALNSL